VCCLQHPINISIRCSQLASAVAAAAAPAAGPGPYMSKPNEVYKPLEKALKPSMPSIITVGEWRGVVTISFGVAWGSGILRAVYTEKPTATVLCRSSKQLYVRVPEFCRMWRCKESLNAACGI
jgi:hypothetical protein